MRYHILAFNSTQGHTQEVCYAPTLAEAKTKAQAMAQNHPYVIVRQFYTDRFGRYMYRVLHNLTVRKSFN
jgi:hypothetical protein